MDEVRRAPVKRWVFWPAATVAIVFVAFAMSMPDQAEAVFDAIQGSIIINFSWYYVLIAAFFVGYCVWIGASRFGRIKLGRDDDEPEFSLGSWFSLLFAAGMGIGLVFYGAAEPLSHFANPRPSVTGNEAALAKQAMTQTFLHWGVHAWAIYVVIGLALAYAIHRRGRPISIRWALEPLLGRRVRGGWGNAIDAVALVGTLFGVATSLGLGVLQISSGLESAGLLKSSDLVDVVLIIVITGVVLFSVVSGVNKGMKWLSNGNLLLAGAVVVFVLIAGPTSFLLRDFVESLGGYLQSFLGLSFNVSTFSGAAGEEWQATWTTFYWGWWISWAPFVGIFIARISRGRTVRQFIAGVLLVPTLMTFFWFSIIGGTALYSQLNGPGGLVGPDNTVDVEGSLFALLDQLPASGILTVGALILIAVFFVTSADSGSLVMGMLATGGQVEPKRWIRVFFACTSSLLAIALLLSGGLEALKTAAIIIGLPFSFIMIGICWSTVTAFTREERAYDLARQASFREHIGDYYGLEVDDPVERPLGDGPFTRLIRPLERRWSRTRRGGAEASYAEVAADPRQDSGPGPDTDGPHEPEADPLPPIS